MSEEGQEIQQTVLWKRFDQLKERIRKALKDDGALALATGPRTPLLSIASLSWPHAIGSPPIAWARPAKRSVAHERPVVGPCSVK